MKTVKQIITFILILCLLSTIGLSAFTDNFIELSTGSSGNEVFKLQKHLTELAYSTNGIDGWHGDGTKNAVESFQSRNGLTVNGIATVKMQQLLFSDSAKLDSHVAAQFNACLSQKDV